MIVMKQSSYLTGNPIQVTPRMNVKRFCAASSVISIDNVQEENTDEPVDLSELENYMLMSHIGGTAKQFAISFRQYKKDKLQKPNVTFIYRIKQFIAWVNRTKETKLSTDIPILVDYLREYLTNYCTGIINSDESVNLMTSLRLTPYIKNRKIARSFQRYLNRAKMELNRVGVINKQTQKLLWGSFNDLFAELLDGITNKIKNKSVMKKELISQAADAIRGKEEVVETQESA